MITAFNGSPLMRLALATSSPPSSSALAMKIFRNLAVSTLKIGEI